MPDWKALGDEAVELTRQYLRIDTTNPPGNETPAAEFLAGILHDAGVETTTLESAPGRGNLVARLPGRARPQGADETASEVEGLHPRHRTMKSNSPSMNGEKRRPNRFVDKPTMRSSRIP